MSARHRPANDHPSQRRRWPIIVLLFIMEDQSDVWKWSNFTTRTYEPLDLIIPYKYPALPCPGLPCPAPPTTLAWLSRRGDTELTTTRERVRERETGVEKKWNEYGRERERRRTWTGSKEGGRRERGIERERKREAGSIFPVCSTKASSIDSISSYWRGRLLEWKRGQDNHLIFHFIKQSPWLTCPLN